MNIREFVIKLQNLSDQQKKAIIIVIVLILSFIFGFFWIRSATERLNKLGEATKDIKLPEIEMPKIELPNNQIQNIEIADWKTYTNEKYGFEIKINTVWDIRYFINNTRLYPYGSGILEAENHDTANDINISIKKSEYNPFIYISVKEYPNTILLDDVLYNYEKTPKLVSREKITIDGKSAYDDVFVEMETCKRDIHFIKNNSDGSSSEFKIGIGRNDLLNCTRIALDNQEFTKLLSTFKFTK